MQTLVVLFCVVVAATALNCSEVHYLCYGHTLCIYPEIGKACNSVKARGVTSDEKQEIVDIHNKYRSRVAFGKETKGDPGPQPPAANMNKLQWDDSLAEVAQRWSDQCLPKHDECRLELRFSYYGVGQNVAYGYGMDDTFKQANWSSVIEGWYNEVKNIKKQNLNPYKGTNVTGHYTQVVWAETEYVGCGFTAYIPKDGFRRTHYVCNYGPAGNVGASFLIPGYPVYKQGETCSACGHHRSCDKSTGLCVLTSKAHS